MSTPIRQTGCLLASRSITPTRGKRTYLFPLRKNELCPLVGARLATSVDILGNGSRSHWPRSPGLASCLRLVNVDNRTTGERIQCDSLPIQFDHSLRVPHLLDIPFSRHGRVD